MITSLRQLILAASVLLMAGGQAEEQGFKPLFNGTDLQGWEGDAKLWSVENGEIVGKSNGLKKNVFLASTDDFKDFVLVFKFKMVDLSKGKGGMVNSGMQFRSQRVPNTTEMSGYQADVGKGYWGSIYDESRRNKTLVKPSDELVAKTVKLEDWNEFKISCDGVHLIVEINGVVMSDYTEQAPPEKAAREGKFGLQMHSGAPLEVHMKDVQIKVLNK